MTNPPADTPRGSDGALISYVVSDDMLDLLTRIDPAPAIQTQRFGLTLLTLLSRGFDRFESYNFVPVQDYPIGRRIRFEGGVHYRGSQRIVTLPFVNLVVLKHVSRFVALVRRYGELRRFGTVVVHGLHLPNLLFASWLLKSAGTRIGVVLTDQQGMILPSDGGMRRRLKAIDRRLSVALARRFDFAIALSDALAATYAPGRPALILPGIYDDALEDRIAALPAPISDSRFRVVYFGGLSLEYGVAALLKALPHLDPQVEVRLFGRGPLEGPIADAATRHPNLFWGGLVDQGRLVEEMAGCDLLINPRPAGGELARMSSPSKLIEYAASGRAVMTTRLPSLSPELMAAALPIDDETPTGIAAAINAAARMNPVMVAQQGADFQALVRHRYAIAGLQAALAPLLRGDADASTSV